MTKTVHFLTFFVTRIIFKLFLDFKVYGRENLTGVKKSAIFSSNHESYFDPFIISSGLPWFSHFHPIRYLTEESLFETFAGKLSKLGAPFEGNLKNGVEYAMRRPLNLLWNNKSVGVFHEWCYKETTLAGRIEKLIPLLSRESGRSIIPIFIYGIEKLSWKKIFLRQGKIAIIYGKHFYVKKHESDHEAVKRFHNSLLGAKLEMLKILDKEEAMFWANYGKLYHHIEEVKPYHDLLKTIGDNISQGISGLWLDLGSGSGAIVELLKKKVKDDCKIIGTDFDSGFIKKIQERFNGDSRITIQELNLCKKIPFENNKFDGVTANLVLPYIVHYEEEVNTAAFKAILSDIYKVLKPGGKFVWSSPKKGVQFFKVFLASREKVFGFDNKERLYYGPALLKQALKIQSKGRRNVYHFLPTTELKEVLSEIGFIEIEFKRSLANQVEVISCKKPL